MCSSSLLLSGEVRWLPGEVWSHVFGFLDHEDRLRMRAVCSDFRDLLDRSHLWRDWTVTLRRPRGAYNQQFWCTLRRWKVSSAAVSSAAVSSGRSWPHLAVELPQLTALIVDGDAALDGLWGFSSLRRLYLRRAQHVSWPQLFSLLPPQLEVLSVCEANNRRRTWFGEGLSSIRSFDSASCLTNLTSLVCHCSFAAAPEDVLPTLLAALPQLMHLSLLAPFSLGVPGGSAPERLSLRHHCLSRLELVDYSYQLQDDLMQMVPCLRSLGLVFGPSHHIVDHPELSLWLQDLPALCCLLVVGGPRLSTYVRSIPPSVTRLTLRPAQINSAELNALSQQLPSLQHLHLEPEAFLGRDTGLLPQLYPGLRSVRLRHERVPEHALLCLTALKELRLLETQDPVPLPTALTSRLRELSQNRVQICHRPDWEPRTCNCTSHLPSGT